MKQKAILLIALLALVSLMITPVMADWQTTPLLAGNISAGSIFPIESADAICIRAGQTGAYPGYEMQVSGRPYEDAPWDQWSYPAPWEYWQGDEIYGYNYRLVNMSDSDELLVPSNRNGTWMFGRAVCSPAATYFVYKIWLIGEVAAPVSSFSCVPTSQLLNTDVICTDTSTNNPTDWLWTIDFESVGVNGWQTSTTQNYDWQSAYAGVFGVNLYASNVIGGSWYNRSGYINIQFINVTPTVTPTPVPTIPAGYVRNNLYVWDQNDAQISGADVDVLDVEAGTWTNTTADADGWITIDTLPYHTVNVYAHYPTSNIYLPNEILGLETGYYGGHNWVIVLYPYTTTPSGFVTLYINTRNYDTKAVLTGVGIQIEDLTTHAVYGYNTGTLDSVWTIVTNATDHRITGSKSGYLSKTIIVNSGEASSKTVVIELSKATVTTTPTGTIPPGGITVPPTQDPNDPALHGGDTSLKGQEMMNWLAMNGMSLVQVCFLVTILALLGVKFGK